LAASTPIRGVPVAFGGVIVAHLLEEAKHLFLVGLARFGTELRAGL
jgi:hypothetical protein